MRYYAPIMLVAFMLPVSAHAECRVDPYRFSFAGGDGTFPVTATVDSGGQCVFRPQAGHNSGIESVTISSTPTHGSSSASGSSTSPTIIYKSKNGYHGQDQFSFAVKGGSSRGVGTATMQVTITVK
jgi:hypothetical protein